MSRSFLDLRADALQIWRAGLDAVRSEQLVRDHLRVQERHLVFGERGDEQESIDLDRVRRIAVIGAGKAGAGMAAAVEETLGPTLIEEKRLIGWINVPADCIRPLQRIHLHPARPAGRNEPTPEGVEGSELILQIVADLGPEDLCISLISGGGSALLPSPIDGISLADKLAVTKFLSAAGADIIELNTVRKQLSRIKGGGLARACNAGRMISLIISDVPGDPLDLIGSGPTVLDPSTPQDALRILDKFKAREFSISNAVFDVLEQRSQQFSREFRIQGRVTNLLIGNNATAVHAAADEAKQLGYHAVPSSSAEPDGAAEEMGLKLARYATLPEKTNWPHRLCYISGGECTVKLLPESERGKGGRNQQTALAALIELKKHDAQNCVVLSGGTDGEDGPTDAAGALVDRAVIEAADNRNLDAADYLRRNDAYHFFEPLDALIKTGPTHTNVCDLRVVLVEPKAADRER